MTALTTGRPVTRDIGHRHATAGALRSARVAVLERPHPPGHRGAVVDRLVPALAAQGALVEVVHAETGVHRADAPPPWDVVVLKSGSPQALHLAAAAEGWGVPCVNSVAATRLTRDKLAATALLRDAGLPLPPSWGLWSDGAGAAPQAVADVLDAVALTGCRRAVVKAARGSQGVGVRWVDVAALPAELAALTAGPWLVMADVPREGDDLKVFVAGDDVAAIHRPFPARDLAAKLGRPADLPDEVRAATLRAGAALGLDCFGCDFVAGPDGWVLVDVNAFPGYKGVDTVPGLVGAVARALRTAAR